MYTLESAAVEEVQMKLRSHRKLLCKFRWQFTREIADQGEQYRWTGHREALKRPGIAAQMVVQITKSGSRGQGEPHKRMYRAHKGAQ